MRVVSGIARGTRLESTDGFDIRPTLDRIKEPVFSMLTGVIAEKNVLDLFSGSGALGIEALSRGAKKCTFVDISEKSLSVSMKNIEKTHFTAQSRCVNSDYNTFLTNSSERFDLIFLDPPYGKNLISLSLECICKNNSLSDDGIIICELDNVDEINSEKLPFAVLKDRKYGRVRILILKRGAVD